MVDNPQITVYRYSYDVPCDFMPVTCSCSREAITDMTS